LILWASGGRNTDTYIRGKKKRKMRGDKSFIQKNIGKGLGRKGVPSRAR